MDHFINRTTVTFPFSSAIPIKCNSTFKITYCVECVTLEQYLLQEEYIGEELHGLKLKFENN
jgi:hypothetical protein